MPRRRNASDSKKSDDNLRRKEAEISILAQVDKDYQYKFFLNDRQMDVTDYCYCNTRSAISEWAHSVCCHHRCRYRKYSSSPPPMLIGVRFFRAQCSRLGRNIPRPNKGTEQGLRRRPVSTLVLCYGAAGLCLTVDLDYHYTCDCKKKLMEENSLRKLLMDKNVSFVGIGVEKDAKSTLSAVGLDMKNPVELQTLVERALGVGDGKKLVIEEMAEIVMEGVSIKKAPENMGNVMPVDGLDEDEWLMFAVRDAFLACEIGEWCFDRIKGTKGK